MESHSVLSSKGENTTTLPDGARFNCCDGRQPQGEAFLIDARVNSEIAGLAGTHPPPALVSFRAGQDTPKDSMEQRRAFPNIQGVVRPQVFTMRSLGFKDDLHYEMDINGSACTLGA
jgi:hypothetical protein